MAFWRGSCHASAICIDERRSEIEGAVLAGDSYRTVAQRFGISRDAVVRHRKHLTPATPNSLKVEQIFPSSTLVEQLQAFTADAQRLKEKAESEGDLRTALAAVKELCRIVELVARLRGEIDGRAQINVLNFQLDAETARRMNEMFLKRHLAREVSP